MIDDEELTSVEYGCNYPCVIINDHNGSCEHRNAAILQHLVRHESANVRIRHFIFLRDKHEGTFSFCPHIFRDCANLVKI